MRTNLTSFLACFGTLALATAAACSSNSSGSDVASDDDYDTVARTMGSNVAADSGGDGSEMGDAIDLSFGVLPIGFSLTSDGHLIGSRLGLDYDYSVSCADSNGDELLVCNDLTDSADLSLDVDGSFSTSTISASVSRSIDWSIDHIQSGLAQFDGDGTFSLDATVALDSGLVRSYSMDVDASYDGLLFDTESYSIVQGSASYAIDAERSVGGDVEASFSIDADIVYHDDGTALLTLDGARQYRINLQTGAVVKL